MKTRSERKTIQGVVISNKMDKTIVVLTERLVKHPKFHKYMRSHKKYYAHDERNNCEIGDKVLLVESKPLSKQKRWRVRDILVKIQ